MKVEELPSHIFTAATLFALAIALPLLVILVILFARFDSERSRL